MNYTENLSLGLPEYGESADVADLNRNSGILDAYCYNTRQIECEPYDSTKNYMSGDLSIHNEVVYECNTDNTTGTWDDSKWDSTTLAEQIAKAKQSGGGQVTKEASGNPIEFTDGADAPLVKCTTAITGSQDLHGYDKPWVGGAGKNKLKVTVDGIKSANGGASSWTGNSKTINSCTWTIETDRAGNVTGLRANTKGSALVNQSILYLDEFTGLSGDFLLSGGLTNSAYITIRLNAAWSQIYSYSKTQGTQVSFTSTDSLQFVLAVNANQTVNDVFLPMLRLEQGTDSSFEQWENKSPITAYTEGEIEVRGKNLFDKNGNDVDKGYLSDKYIAIQNNRESFYTPSSGYWYVSEYIQIESSKQYVLSGLSTIDSNAPCLSIYDENKNFINGIVYQNARQKSITTPSNAKFIRISVGPFSDSSDNIQLEVGSSATDYEEYRGTTHTTTYPSAIYRGSEDVVKGTVECVKKKITISSGIQLYGNYGVDNAPLYYYDTTSDIAPYYNSLNPIENRLISNCYNATTGIDEGRLGDFEFRTNANPIGSANRFYFRDSRYTTAADFNAWIANNPIEIVYSVYVPTTSSVTPTYLPIKSLSGYTHIESSTGDMEVEYITEEYQPLVDLIQSGNGHTYSTSEQVVGKWIDGNTVYERTIYISGTLVMESTNVWVDSGVDISYVNRIVSFNAIMYDGSGAPALWCGKSGNNLMLLTSRGNTFNGLYAVLRYTKSTTTRSLSAPVTSQKAQIEPLTDKTEEVPTEEEKAVNEEENNDER